MSDPIEVVLSRLKGFKKAGDGQYEACCPAHGDRHASLSIKRGDDGRVLLHCHAGCKPEEIVRAVGKEMKDLFCGDGTAQSAKGRAGLRKEKEMWSSARAGAAAFARREGGTIAGDWSYPGGTFSVARIDLPDGSKTFRPFHRTSKGWQTGDPDGPLPLYRGDGLPPDGCPVIVVEGEKCADAARGIGLAAVTSAHGAKSPKRSDWSPLAGRDVVILPDANEAGELYAVEVGMILAGLVPPARVKLVRLPGLPPGGDIVDWIEARDSQTPEELKAALIEMVEAAPPYEPPAPEMGTACRPFPVEALPEPIRSFVVQGAKALGCDPSYLALPMLAALASAIGNSRVLRLKDSWCEPHVLWTVIVGESGTLKSPAVELVMGPLYRREQRRWKTYQAALAEYESALEIYNADFSEWWRKGRRRGEPKPEPPVKPICGRLIVSDVTVEALADRLAESPRGLLLWRDELGGWLASFDCYRKHGRGVDAAAWTAMHGARTLVIDRKTGERGTIHIPRAAVCITGGIQPGVLRRLLGEVHFENGVAARLFMAMPPRRPKRWNEGGVEPEVEPAVEGVFDRLLSLEPHADSEGEPYPVEVSLTPEAKEGWIVFYNEHAREELELTGDLAAASSKLEGGAARLALVVHLVKSAASGGAMHGPIDAQSMEAGIALARWFENEARRVYETLGESEEEGRFRRHIELIQRKDGRITARELQQADRKNIRSAEEADQALCDLEKAGYGRWEGVPPGPRGGRPTREFVLHGMSTQRNPPEC